MTYTVAYTTSAAKTLRELDKSVARRLLGAIAALANGPRPAGCLQLRGGEGAYRIRVGDYRIIYDVLDDEVVVLVLQVGHRREIYR